jgi:ATP-dependent Clp protease ATP-binding subunit ClpA
LIAASASLGSIIATAHEQARLLGHDYVGTEHLLLALAHSHPELLPDPQAVRPLILDILGHGL